MKKLRKYKRGVFLHTLQFGINQDPNRNPHKTKLFFYNSSITFSFTFCTIEPLLLLIFVDVKTLHLLLYSWELSMDPD